MTDPFQELWLRQPITPSTFTLEELRARTKRTEHTLRRRNAWEYVAAALVAVTFGWFSYSTANTLARIGHLLTIAGTLMAVWRLWRSGRSPSSRADSAADSAAACATFYIGLLEQQRELLRTVWRWYLGPMLPGLFIVFAAHGLEAGGVLARVLVAVSAFIVVSVFVAIAHLNEQASRKLELEIQQLRSTQERGE